MIQPPATARVATKTMNAMTIQMPSSRSISKPHDEPDFEPEPELEPLTLDAVTFDWDATSASVKLPDAPPPPKLPPPGDNRGTSTPVPELEPEPEPKPKSTMLLDDDPRAPAARDANMT